jgi:uncharacterized protein (TIRG00374 family)
MKFWKLALISILSALFVYLFLKRIDFHEIKKIWLAIPPLYPLFFLLLAFPQYYIRAYRWGLLLSPFKKNIAISSLLNFTLIGFMISYLLPGRLGEIARPVMLAEKEKIKKSQAIATIINERLFAVADTAQVENSGFTAFAGGLASILCHHPGQY